MNPLSQASATLASCFTSSSGSSIAFSWTHVASAVLGNATAPAGGFTTLDLDPASSSRRDLYVRGSSLTPGIRYTLRVRGCMASDPTVCGVAQTDIGERG